MVCRQSLFLLTVFFCAASAALEGDAPLAVTVSGGRVRGVLQGDRRIFRGIPYTAPPLGDLRWRPPQPHPGWEGERDASDFGPSCLAAYHWASINFSRSSEDCLTINVVTPNSQGRFPVMVYFHAGEFIVGSSYDAESDFPYFANDVVLVTPNSRLNAFGYLADDVLRARDPLRGTGNYGVLDQRFALKWVQANIAAFGGDAANVAIAGESSGATCVIFHLTANGPTSTDLFHKAILQSPGITQVKSWEDATMNSNYVVSLLTAMSSPNCTRSGGYTSFKNTLLTASAHYGMVHVSRNETVDSALQWCDRNRTCKGFTWDPTKNETTFVGIQDETRVYNHYWHLAQRSGVTVFLQQGPVETEERTQCLLSADAQLLTNITCRANPRGDTVFVDSTGPTIDGVYLNETLVSKVARGAVAEGVDVLTGSNLDEGTEFINYAPRIVCNATSNELAAWAKAFYGTEIGSSMPSVYQSLQRPLPKCRRGLPKGHAPVSGEESLHYIAAMRSSGDCAFRCPAHKLAHVARGRSYLYHFTLTPNFSLDMNDLQVAGAFHGAEVPFVFGYGVELKTTAERNLSKTMGCYWRNFLWHGDPNKEACGTVPNTTFWPLFNDSGRGTHYLELGSKVSVQTTDAQLEARCTLFDNWMLKSPVTDGRQSHNGPTWLFV